MVTTRAGARRASVGSRDRAWWKPLRTLLLTCGLAGLSLLPVRADEFTVQHTGADQAWSQHGLSGHDVTVAVVDSGVQYRYDLRVAGSTASRILTRVNFVSGSTQVYDMCGHGTHIAGIIAGNGYDSTGSNYFRTFYGIAPQARIVSVRVLNDYGQGRVSDVIAGIQWCIKNRVKHNIRVMNLSLGHPVGEPYETDPLCQAVKAAWNAGIVVVCAAGNGGRQQSNADPNLDNEGFGTAYGSIQSPANSPYVITVGAMKQDPANPNDKAADRLATYSSRGPSRLDYVLKPDLVAPGNRVIALNAVNSYLSNTYPANRVPWSDYMHNPPSGDSTWYFRLSGTSMAAPVVAGAAALMLQKEPTLTPDTVKARLMVSADKIAFPDGTANPCAFGAGYLNIPAALASTIVATGPALSPSLYRDEEGNVYVDM